MDLLGGLQVHACAPLCKFVFFFRLLFFMVPTVHFSLKIAKSYAFWYQNLISHRSLSNRAVGKDAM